MGDNQAPDQQKEAIKGPPSLSLPAATNSPPSRKRLLADLKPKQGLAAASPGSSVSADSLSDRFPKKTRETPNLSNCHGCGLRINYSNPKERLQTLDSLWRIVLLCRKCFKRVESAEICSYCFSGTCEEVCFRCTGCKRCIHKDCVVKFGRFPPWSYCSSETGFLHCVDCWIPKLLVDSTRVYRRRKIVDKSVQEPVSVGDSRVSVNSNNPKIVHDAVKKIAVAVKAKANALSKHVVAKSAVQLAKDEKHDSCSSDATTIANANDGDLAFQLHRAINSSPRIFKNEFLLNSSCLAVQNSRALDLEGSSIELGNLIGEEVTYKKESVKSKQQDMQNQESQCNESSNLLHDGGSNEKPDNRYLLKYSKRCDRNRAILRDRYLLKYKKRPIKSIADSNTENKFCDDSLHLENKASELKCDSNSNDRFLLKYSKRRVRLKQFQSCAVHVQ